MLLSHQLFKSGCKLLLAAILLDHRFELSRGHGFELRAHVLPRIRASQGAAFLLLFAFKLLSQLGLQLAGVRLRLHLEDIDLAPEHAFKLLTRFLAAQPAKCFRLLLEAALESRARRREHAFTFELDAFARERVNTALGGRQRTKLATHIQRARE